MIYKPFIRLYLHWGGCVKGLGRLTIAIFSQVYFDPDILAQVQTLPDGKFKVRHGGSKEKRKSVSGFLVITTISKIGVEMDFNNIGYILAIPNRQYTAKTATSVARPKPRPAYQTL